MRHADLAYVAPIPGVDHTLVGELINAGVHHRVYEYGDDQLIKIPRRRYGFMYSEKAHLERDLELIQRYFPGLAVDTEIFASADHRHHCVVQKYMRKYHLITPSTYYRVERELATILVRNQNLLRETQHSLDLVGGDGVKSFASSLLYGGEPFFSNLVMIKQGQQWRLQLVDTDLLRWKMSELTLAEGLRALSSLGSYLTTAGCLKWLRYLASRRVN